MKNRRSVFFPFVALLVFVISVGCLCSGLTGGTPTEAPAQPVQQKPTEAPPVQEPTVAAPPTQKPTVAAPAEPPTSDNSGWVTFTDENNFYAIDVPADWTYEQTVDSENGYFYIDTFTSPDGGAVIENIAYDDGKPFTGNDKSTAALFFLNNWYSSTGREGDIRVSKDQIMKDGSEQLIWTSKGGGYSGISYLETRGTTTFLFFTVNWGNAVEDQYLDILNTVIESYRIP